MKTKLLLFCIFTFLLLSSFQTDLQNQGYLLNEFTEGTVLFKSGIKEVYLLNYDTNNKNICFKKNNQILYLTNFADIDTIYFNDKKYIAIDEKFYYLAANTGFPLFVSYTNNPHPITTTTDHNGTSRQYSNQVSNTISDIYITRRFKDNNEVEFKKDFLLKKSEKYYTVNTEKQFIKAFASKEKAIKDFIKTNKTDFSREADVVKLVIFCN